MGDREKFWVAVTVFVEAEAVDETDALFIAERAVKDAITKSSTSGPPSSLNFATLEFKAWNRTFEVTVHVICEIGRALRNGYLWCQPTTKSFPTQDPYEDRYEDNGIPE